MDSKSFTQQIEVAGDKLVDEVKKLYDDANAKRVTIKDKDGKEIFSLPLAIGIGGGAIVALAAPALAAVAAVGGILAKVKLEIERDDKPADIHVNDPLHMPEDSDSKNPPFGQDSNF